MSSDIDKKIADVDRDLKLYVDMKIRAVKRMLSFWIWLQKHPKISFFIFIACIAAGIWLSHRIDARQVIKNETGIEITNPRHNPEDQ